MSTPMIYQLSKLSTILVDNPVDAFGVSSADLRGFFRQVFGVSDRKARGITPHLFGGSIGEIRGIDRLYSGFHLRVFGVSPQKMVV
jgi:hypothetical protein